MASLIICNCENLESVKRDSWILARCTDILGYRPDLCTVLFAGTHAGALKQEIQILSADGKRKVVVAQTMDDLRDAAKEFVDRCNTHRRGFLSLGSHGNTGLTSTDKSESDGKDEYVHMFGRVIRDNELKDLFLMPLQKDVDVFVLTDTCSSGTMWDLPLWTDARGGIHRENQLWTSKGDNMPNILSISGCDDRGTSMDDYGHFGYSGGLVASLADFLVEEATCLEDTSGGGIRRLVRYIFKRLAKVRQHVLVSSTKESILKSLHSEHATVDFTLPLASATRHTTTTADEVVASDVVEEDPVVNDENGGGNKRSGGGGGDGNGGGNGGNTRGFFTGDDRVVSPEVALLLGGLVVLGVVGGIAIHKHRKALAAASSM